MLYRGHLLSALDERRDDFASCSSARCATRWARRRGVCALSAADGCRRWCASRVAARRRACELIPSAELDAAGGVVVAVRPALALARGGARVGARRACEARVTFAADGSQIYPGREVSLPVAAVQIASFENPHTPGGDYTKEVALQASSRPDELLAGGRAYESPEQVVGVAPLRA